MALSMTFVAFAALLVCCWRSQRLLLRCGRFCFEKNADSPSYRGSFLNKPTFYHATSKFSYDFVKLVKLNNCEKLFRQLDIDLIQLDDLHKNSYFSVRSGLRMNFLQFIPCGWRGFAVPNIKKLWRFHWLQNRCQTLFILEDSRSQLCCISC